MTPVVLSLVLVLLLPWAAWPQGVQPAVDSLLDRVAAEQRLRGRAAALAFARDRGLRTSGDGRVAVIVEPAGRDSRTVDLAALRRLGVTVDATSRSLLRVWSAPDRLQALAGQAGVARLRRPLRALPLDGFGPTVSEGLGLSGASELQADDVTGKGVKIAVIDVDFFKLAQAQANGDLPMGVVTQDYTGAGMEGSDAHGTSVAEIVVDMAPGAELYLIRTADLLDLENAADYVATNGIPIVNLSLAYPSASYYDDTGPVNDIVNDSSQLDGVFWAVAAGNFKQRHWRGGWTDANGNSILEFDGAGDERIGLEQKGGEVCVFVNWDQYDAQHTNLDLWVYKASGAVQAKSERLQRFFPPAFPPAEDVCFPYVASDAPYEAEVRHISGPTGDLDITLFTFGHVVEHEVAEYSLMDPANATGAFSVTAILARNWDTGNSPNSYSSRGPTHDDDRIKPDLMGMDAVMAFSRATFGTSFASPHVAGAAALLLEQDPTLTPDQIAGELQAVAEDIGAVGIDPVFGAGKLVADETLGGLLDSDGDGVVNQDDNCRHTQNNSQLDLGGVLTGIADGIGDACQCGDVTDTGQVLGSDVDAIRELFAGLSGPLAAPQKCNVHGPADGGFMDCGLVDVVVLRRGLMLPTPAVGQLCAPALSP